MNYKTIKNEDILFWYTSIYDTPSINNIKTHVNKAIV